MVDKQFIITAFEIIKNSFDEFKDIDIAINVNSYKEYDKSFSPFRADWAVNTVSGLNNVSISIMNELELLKENKPKRYNNIVESDSDFLSSFYIPITEETIILLCLLHEFGHIYQVLKFMQHAKPHKFKHYIDNMVSCISLVFEYKKTNLYVNDIYSNFRPDELYAECFKYKYFYKFYKLMIN